MTRKEKLLAAFKAAEDINSSLWNAAVDPLYMSVDEFHEHVKDKFGVAVEIKVVDVETDHVYGFIERYENGSSTIYIVKNIPPRFKRLVGTKELCQIVIDKKDEFRPDGQDTMQRLFLSPVQMDLDAPENVALLSEFVAEVVAWELLYPHEFRKSDKERIAAGILSVAEVASRLRLPETVVMVILSPPYLQMCDELWAQVMTLKSIKAAE